MIDAVELLDLPDEIILTILKKVDPQVLLFCSMINIGNSRLERLVFDRCHSIDLTFDYGHAPHKQTYEKQFYSHVLSRISHQIQSLTIDISHNLSINRSLQNICIEHLPNLKHVKLMLGTKYSKTGIPWTKSNFIIIGFPKLFTYIELFGRKKRNENFNVWQFPKLSMRF